MKYEYKTLYYFHPEELDEAVSKHLNDGWQICGHQYMEKTANGYYFFQPLLKINI